MSRATLILAVGIALAPLACNIFEPEPVRISISGPTTVTVGDVIPLTVYIKGVRKPHYFWIIPEVRVASMVGEDMVYGTGAGTATAYLYVMREDSADFSTEVGTDSITLTVVPPPPSNRPAFSLIESGERSSCALSADGSTYCWGFTTAGRAYAPRCEDYITHGGGASCNSVPVKRADVPQFKYLSAGTYSTCGITLSNDAFCWGIGPNNYGNMSGVPSTVPGGIRFTTVSVETGYGLNNGSEVEHVCGIDANRQLYCWQRGGRPTNPLLMPGANYATVALGGVSSLVGDKYRACALDIDGVAYCWGTNPLGDGNPGSSTDRTSPVAVGGALRFTAIAAETYATCALATDGAPYCWGSYPTGPVLVPTAIPTSVRFTAISAAADRFCAIATDQSAYCWQDIGSNAPPVQVQGSYHFRSISVGGDAVCGLTSEGPEVCWGSRNYGALGDGRVGGTSTAVPTPIAGQRIWL